MTAGLCRIDLFPLPHDVGEGVHTTGCIALSKGGQDSAAGRYTLWATLAHVEWVLQG